MVGGSGGWRRGETGADRLNMTRLSGRKPVLRKAQGEVRGRVFMPPVPPRRGGSRTAAPVGPKAKSRTRARAGLDVTIAFSSKLKRFRTYAIGWGCTKINAVISFGARRVAVGFCTFVQE